MNMDKIIDSIDLNQRLISLKNKNIISDYFKHNDIFKKNNNVINSIQEVLYEKEILFMIKHFVSIKFIKKYFNLNSDKYIINIAKKHKCQSYILSSFTENTKARCFSKNQIMRACEEFNYICPMCFKYLDITNMKTITGHHILPFARGGLTKKENCLPLHVKCHFDDFKTLHAALFDEENIIYSAMYFKEMKDKLNKNHKSGMDFILKNFFHQDK